MNSTQIQTILASLVGAAAMWLASKVPFIDQATWATWINTAITFITTAVIGWLNRKTALITTVAQQPEVKQVVLEQSAPAALVQATPSNVSK